jgi:hypothetical protein
MARVSQHGRQRLREWESQNGFADRHSFFNSIFDQAEGRSKSWQPKQNARSYTGPRMLE